MHNKLQKGQPTPVFSINDVNNSPVTLQGKKSLIIFFRSVGCPMCNLHVHDLVKKQKQIQEADLQIVLIYESSKENLLNYVKDQNLEFTFVADPLNMLYDLFAIEKSFLKVLKGMFSGGMEKMKEGNKLFKKKLPQDGSQATIGADFLIGEDGKVIKAHYGRYVGDHLPVSDVLSLAALPKTVSTSNGQIRKYHQLQD